MSKEQLMKKSSAGALAVSNLEADANMGMGNITQEDLALPFLKILGQLSSEVNKRDGKYVEGATPGMIYNTVTGDLFDGEKGIQVIPCDTCAGCDGVANSSLTLDQCFMCDGGVDSSTGAQNIPAVCEHMGMDQCLSITASNGGIDELPYSWMDCNDLCFGYAFIDYLAGQGQCAAGEASCIGGDTGIDPTFDASDDGNSAIGGTQLTIIIIFSITKLIFNLFSPSFHKPLFSSCNTNMKTNIFFIFSNY